VTCTSYTRCIRAIKYTRVTCVTCMHATRARRYRRTPDAVLDPCFDRNRLAFVIALVGRENVRAAFVVVFSKTVCSHFLLVFAAFLNFQKTTRERQCGFLVSDGCAGGGACRRIFSVRACSWAGVSQRINCLVLPWYQGVFSGSSIRLATHDRASFLICSHMILAA